ncbi:FMN-binding negative transcriptional regulator [Bradyrhizobium elkanii]|uniref:FMN-binding negative transcriptional regulator n=1 Tax=Bradyrhizobium elkanii TaxID=29448 RepID=A0A4U6RJW5_BRAEL|nr:FMN-binding negative transcriptional regulator [Bradyrhizobium elkanii]TKV73362.1 FMN-binding negative transcriptional regulator [Bradyrhizobium elkanii]
MYLPPHFKMDELGPIHAAMRAAKLATLVTATADGLIATPLPLILNDNEGDCGTLYGHVARPNPQWKLPAVGEAMAIFMGPDAYVTPSWYATKAEHGKVVPTWNYVAVHAYGAAEFFEDADRLLDVVTRLTELHEKSRPEAWQVSDAPDDFIKVQLRGIVGFRMPITRIDAKRKMSQNRKPEDRAGVIAGLGASDDPVDREVAAMIPAH